MVESRLLRKAAVGDGACRDGRREVGGSCWGGIERGRRSAVAVADGWGRSVVSGTGRIAWSGRRWCVAWVGATAVRWRRLRCRAGGDAVRRRGIAVHGSGSRGCSIRHDESSREGRNGDFHAVFPRLGSQRSLGRISMSLPFAILLVGVLHRDFLVHHVLAVHMLNRLITALEIGETDKAVALAEIRIIPRDLGHGEQLSEAGKRLVQNLFIRHVVQIPDEQLRPHTSPAHPSFTLDAFIGRGFVDADGFAPQTDLVHYFAGIVGVLFAAEFDEAVALVGLRHAVFGEVYVDDGARLEHEFPDEGIGAAFVEVADVEGAVFVLFPEDQISRY